MSETSLGLSREAAKTEAEIIVFCGVHFMAETAAILSPNKMVLLPDLAAGCSLAATIDGDQLRDWKAEHPGAVAVSSPNTTADGGKRAESDYCRTSGNAVEIVNPIPADTEVLFFSDMLFVRTRTSGRPAERTCMSDWRARRAPHAGIDPEHITGSAPLIRGEPSSLIHPECGCATSAVEAVSACDVGPRRCPDPLDRRNDQPAAHFRRR